MRSAGLGPRHWLERSSAIGSATETAKMVEASSWLLDTSALLALRGNEEGADRVEELLAGPTSGTGQILASFMTRMELSYIVRRDEGEDAAREAFRLLDGFPIEWVSCEPTILEAAATLKAAGGLSVADSWIAATALVRGAVLVHRDPEFTPLQQIRQ